MQSMARLQSRIQGRSLFLEFMVRRCFFPYALCAFAVFNIMSVAFVLSVIGANLVWPISLYSSRTFGIPPTTVVVSPAASP